MTIDTSEKESLKRDSINETYLETSKEGCEQTNIKRDSHNKNEKINRIMTIKIETDNDAFCAGNKSREVSRILKIIADRIKEGETSGKVRDINGNTVGEFSL